MKDVILGILDIGIKIYNFVLLHGKQYLFNCKCANIFPIITAIRKILKDVCTLEKHIAIKNDKHEVHVRKWKNINS